MSTGLFVGDLTLDLTMLVDHVPAPDEKVHVTETSEAAGGVIVNAAVACALSGTASRALLQLGTDAAAGLAVEALRARGPAVAASFAEGRTARVVILIEPHGEKRLLLDPGVSMYPGVEAVHAADLSDIGWVHTAVYGEAAWPLVTRCRAAGIPFSLDLEPATFLGGIDTLAALLPGALLFCNDRAAALIGPDAEVTLLTRGARAVIRTRGPRGARFVTAGGAFDVPAPDRGAVVDTTGAGDCLAGWFVGERLAGRSPEAALRGAVVAATLSCGRPGAQMSYPARAEVDALLGAVGPVPAQR
jgi:ribokinase